MTGAQQTLELSAATVPPASTGPVASGLQVFQQRELRAAYDHSIAGGQALHLMDGSFAYQQSRTPSCFKGRKQIAHLFDMNLERLISSAKRFGVRVILTEHTGTYRQHIDLCGKPLERAIVAALKRTACLALKL
jgi:hypothetical protein